MPLVVVPNAGGVISDENLGEVVHVATAALKHVIAQGETPEFKGRPMKVETAVAYLRDFLGEQRLALIQGSSGFLEATARRIVQADGPDVPIEEFEASLAELSDLQLTELSELNAEDADAITKGIVDARREFLGALLATGRVLLRGAIASGLTAVLGPADPVAEAASSSSEAPAPSGDLPRE